MKLSNLQNKIIKTSNQVDQNAVNISLNLQGQNLLINELDKTKTLYLRGKRTVSYSSEWTSPDYDEETETIDGDSVEVWSVVYKTWIVDIENINRNSLYGFHHSLAIKFGEDGDSTEFEIEEQTDEFRTFNFVQTLNDEETHFRLIYGFIAELNYNEYPFIGNEMRVKLLLDFINPLDFK